ncbi:hypothetical protein [Sorangium sp. So ce394]
MPCIRAAALIALVTLTSGCAARSQPASPVPVEIPVAPAQRTAEAQAAGNAAPGGVVLVWGSVGDGAPRTWHLAEGGAVIREEPGIVVATRRGEWRWETREEQVATSACEMGLGEMREPGEGTATRAALVLRGKGERQEVISPPDGDESNEIHHTAALIGSVGPYLFIEERTYTDLCGAHGFEGAGFVAWDAERRAAVDLLAEVRGVTALQSAAEALLDDGEDGAEAAGQERDAPELVQIAPAYDERGALRLTAQLARSACYACSDGAWSSYSRSAVVPVERTPARLAAWASTPPDVRAFLERTPGVRLGGWSQAGQEE